MVDYSRHLLSYRFIYCKRSFNTACELGFRGSLDEWERLMGAVAKR